MTGVTQHRALLQRIRTIENVKARASPTNAVFIYVTFFGFSPETRRVLETLFEFHCLLHNSILELTVFP